MNDRKYEKNNDLKFDLTLLKENPLAFKYYNKIDEFYKERDKIINLLLKINPGSSVEYCLDTIIIY